MLTHDYKLNLQRKCSKEIMRQFNEGLIYAPTAHKTEDQVMILKMTEGKDGKKTAPAPDSYHVSSHFEAAGVVCVWSGRSCVQPC